MKVKLGKAIFKNALVSVSDKKGLEGFIRPLAESGMRVVSTGGTFAFIKKAGISALDLSQQTGFTEVMDGRVKSLHPRVYMPLLARLNHKGDNEALKDAGLLPFDLVVCNLYPFKEKQNEGEQNLTEWIDVGGPCLLRAAAKNFERVTVLCDPADYQPILLEGEKPDLNRRRQLAGKAFALLTSYNSHIAQWMNGVDPLSENKEESQKTKTSGGAEGANQLKRCGSNMQSKKGSDFTEAETNNKKPDLSEAEITKKSWQEGDELCIKGRFYKQLRYGENPNQKAVWFQTSTSGLHQAEFLNGKALSYNNICDLDAALSTLREFEEPCAVAVKHNNPCAVACDTKTEKALHLALKADPVSVFGGVLAINQQICQKTAQILSSIFLEAVIAPDYESSAIQILKEKKKNLRVIRWPGLMAQNKNNTKVRFVEGGLLAQSAPKISSFWSADWKCIADTPPSEEIKKQLLMAWKVCAHLKSNAISLVSNCQTTGLSTGQVNRVSAVKQAIQKWKSFHPELPPPVLASDGFFPFPDSVKEAGAAGIKWIIQPGGSLRDLEVIATAKALSVNMVLTGQRCFAH